MASSPTSPLARDEVGRELKRRLRRAFAASIAVRALESLGVGWLACALALSAAHLGVGSASGPAWWPGSIAGVCAALSWWLEGDSNFDRFVRRVDRRNALGGALTTALDSLARARPGVLVALLVERIEHEVSPRACIAAAFPRTPAVLAAPLLGLALFLADVDARSGALAQPPTLAEASHALLAAAQDLRGAAPSTAAPSTARSPAAAAQASNADLARETERTARALADLASRERTKGDLDRLQQDLGVLRERLVREALETTPVLADPVRSRALGAIDAARTAVGAELENAGSRAQAAPSVVTPAGAPSAASNSGTAAIATANGAGGDTSVASSAVDGRMSAPNAGVTPVDGAGATGTTPAIEHGTPTLRWWAPTYDAVVERWAEARRGARDP
jgi:hypothetical protein